ncbi:hypothetical protein GCM10007079_41960 [Nocardiopsis terrae]|nr:hypothetical protein GCM10007079_41960 [Nocardiopsis terrae]
MAPMLPAVRARRIGTDTQATRTPGRACGGEYCRGRDPVLSPNAWGGGDKDLFGIDALFTLSVGMQVRGARHAYIP